MFEIKKIDIISFAKVSALINGFFGLIIGVIFTLFSLIIYFIGNNPGMGISSIVGLISIITFPAVFGFAGFVIGGLIGWIYNISSKRFKGIKIEIGEIDEEEIPIEESVLENQDTEQQEMLQKELQLKGDIDTNNPPKPSE